MPNGAAISGVLVLLMVLCLSNSTVSAGWVPHSEVLTNLALIAAVILGVLALTPVPWTLALGLGLVAAPLAGYLAAYPALHAGHPNDPGDPIGLGSAWLGRVASGDAFADASFYLYLLSCLFWVVGGWLSWCVLRWRQPLLGLVPGAAAFATNVLNYPSDQNGYTLAFLILTLALLLWTSYQRSLENATRRRVKLTGDARWDFWESGVVVMAAVIALGIFLPPLSNADRTVDIENGSFRGWAELQQRLNHPVAFGHGQSAGTSIGFATDVPLGGPIHKTGGVVMTYTIDGNFGGPRYFRGLNLERTSLGPDGSVWRYAQPSIAFPIEKDLPPPYGEQYQAEQTGGFKVQMLKPPDRASDVLFYPGNLMKIDRNATAHSSVGLLSVPGLTGTDRLNTLDRLSGGGRLTGAGTYKVTVQYSNATEDQLRQAGATYPGWLDPYRNFTNTYSGQAASSQASRLPGYRSSDSLQRIHDLAVQVTAGKDNPYDQAQAIETFLRANYSYTLTPPAPPKDADPLDYFLFTSKQGYCEYFASAMGDMLRSLGIPTRLVNGFGPGSFDEKLSRYVVRESDAHTWVEVYYPHYGWIPFEPTPDGVYFPVPRGSAGGACERDATACDSGTAGPVTSGATNPRPDKGNIDSGDATGGGSGSLPLPVQFPIALAALLVLVAAAWVGVSRYLRPRTVNGVWRRVTLLTSLAGLSRRDSETPLEFGARLAREVPEAARPARELAQRFTVAAYAPREVAVEALAPALSVWEELRPALLRRVRLRFHLA
ncbi:transglutaminase domain-containing protein [Candidatus Nephthysia bennettiae]|uniref:Transglutaminase domain-containing protein n=1 Tax=Candidatus Nephthysia bennettiae TaxID=3127016 RepID=A0A934N477_9BACT|nr:transglutaminase domain-containing protein [Candidatus Dormibacteraeota bacterium]MBJ7614672.1 transglutaminase domain-containing protein [Candidatus Dormibacteraeota bacterium]